MSSREMDETEAADLVDSLIKDGIPLTLLADLINPFGPGTQRILAEEKAEADEPDDDDFSQPQKR